MLTNQLPEGSPVSWNVTGYMAFENVMKTDTEESLTVKELADGEGEYSLFPVATEYEYVPVVSEAVIAVPVEERGPCPVMLRYQVVPEGSPDSVKVTG